MRRERRTQFGSAVFVLLLLLSGFFLVAPGTVSAAQDGDYSYTTDGLAATIIGYTGTGGAVTIPSTLGGYATLNIGNYAFANLTSLTSVIIPNSVASVGESAFENCANINSVTIGNNVTSIGRAAFAHCPSLASVTFLGLVAPTSVGVYLFYDTSGGILGHAYAASDFPAPGSNFWGLTMGALIDGVYTYRVNENGVTITGYYGSETTISIPSTFGGHHTVSIGDYAFEYDTSLTSVAIPNGVTSIGNYSFQLCTSLISVNIPGSVASLGFYTFGHCISLTSIAIPDSVVAIGDYAFAECFSLSSLSIGSGVTSIGEDAFAFCTSLTSINIPIAMKSIGVRAYFNCSSLTSVTIPDGVTYIGDFAFSHCTLLSSLIIGDGITSLNNESFSYCSSLTSVAIPGSVRLIWNSAFSSCSSLTSVTIPDSALRIGDFAFYGCALVHVSIPNSVTDIGQYAFAACSALTSVIIPPNITSVMDHLFSSCTSLAAVVIPYGVNYIGDYAFSNCISLTSVSVPDSVVYLNAWAFYNCTSLTSITLGRNVESIGRGTFRDCTSLTSIAIPSKVEFIENLAFYNCASLTSISFFGLAAPTMYGAEWIFGTPTEIRGHAYVASNFPSPGGDFHGLIMGEVIPGDYIYTISEGEATIIGYAGAGGEVTIPSTLGGYPTVFIGDEAFADCSAITSVTIPGSVTSIGYHAFYDCPSLDAIIVNASNQNYSSIDGVLYDKTITTLLQCPGARAGSFTIPSSIISIEDSAFANCVLLTSVVIPNSVTSIGGYAFQFCFSLASVTLGNNVASVGSFAFYYCTLLTSVTIPNSVTSIGNNAFASCTSLASVSIPDNVTYLGDAAFLDCRSLSTVAIGSGVTSIRDSVFGYCFSLISVTIPEGVTAIGPAFYYCDSLISITFLGLVAPVSVDYYWIYGNSPALTGHAYAESNFPAPGNYFYGLMMGDAIPASGSPGIPQGLIATGGNTKINLTWNAPDYNGGSAITNYTLYRSLIEAGPYTALITLSGTSYTDNNLTNGHTYWYKVSAANSLGEGMRTAPVSSTPFTVPNAPTGLYVFPGNTEVALSWNEPLFNGGATVDYYIIFLNGVALPENTNYLSVNVSGLGNGQTYTFTVAAHNSAGIGAQSDPVLETPFTIPNAPTSLTAISGRANVTLNWTAPAFDGGRTIDYYVIYQDDVALSDHFTGLTTVIDGLTSDQSYSFKVAAHNLAGIGVQSSITSATPTMVPDAPTGLIAIPSNAQVTLNWTAPAFDGGHAIDYYIAYQDDVALPGHIVGMTTVITSLVNGQSYSFTVAAHNLAGMGVQSNAVSSTPYNVPDAPTGLTAAAGSDKITLNWSAPAINGGSSILDYNIYRSTSETGTYSLIASPTGLTYNDTGLTNGQTYWYKVSAVNAIGTGANCSAASALVPQTISPSGDNTILIVVAVIAIAVVLVAALLIMRKRKN